MPDVRESYHHHFMSYIVAVIIVALQSISVLRSLFLRTSPPQRKGKVFTANNPGSCVSDVASEAGYPKEYARPFSLSCKSEVDRWSASFATSCPYRLAICLREVSVSERYKRRCRGDLPSVFIQDDRHTRRIQSIPLGHQTLSEPIRNVVRAEKPRNDDRQMRGNDRECGNVPVLQDFPFEFQVAGFAAWKGGTGIASVGGGCLDEGGEVAAAIELGDR
jgi:hypothetical protein